jgi:hypothetical protein
MPDDLRRLQEMAERGYSAPRAAVALRRSINGIKFQAKKIGCPFPDERILSVNVGRGNSKQLGEEIPMMQDEKEMKWRRVAEELRTVARRVPRGPTRDKLFQRANQLEESAMLRRCVIAGLLYPLGDDPRTRETHH